MTSIPSVRFRPSSWRTRRRWAFLRHRTHTEQGGTLPEGGRYETRMSDSSPIRPSPSDPDALLAHLFFTAPAQEKGTKWRGVLGSLVLHACLLALVLWLTRTHFTAFRGDVGAGQGV